eukprot:513841-Alexandrium_andersonii.AAC.1
MVQGLDQVAAALPVGAEPAAPARAQHTLDRRVAGEAESLNGRQGVAHCKARLAKLLQEGWRVLQASSQPP